MLPKSLAIPLCYDPMGTPYCRSEFADLWKGKYNGQEVAAKTLRICQTSDLDRIRKVVILDFSVYRRTDWVPCSGSARRL